MMVAPLIFVHGFSAHLDLQLATFYHISKGDMRVGEFLTVEAVFLNVYLIILGHFSEGFVIGDDELFA